MARLRRKSPRERVHMFRHFKSCRAIFRRHRIFTGPAACRLVDTSRRVHRMVPRAALKRRHVLFSGTAVDAAAPMRRIGASSNAQ